MSTHDQIGSHFFDKMSESVDERPVLPSVSATTSPSLPILRKIGDPSSCPSLHVATILMSMTWSKASEPCYGRYYAATLRLSLTEFGVFRYYCQGVKHECMLSAASELV